MKSKPVYNPLSLDPTARRHVFVADGPDAGAAVSGLLRANGQSAPIGNIRVLASCPGQSLDKALNVVADIFETTADIKAAVGNAIRAEGMGTAFYVAGTERFVWETHRILRDAGVTEMRIRLTLAGSPARSVYCIHCGAIDGPVEDSVHVCARCGTVLAVRDHFSRYHGAYMGVRAIADPRTQQAAP